VTLRPPPSLQPIGSYTAGNDWSLPLADTHWPICLDAHRQSCARLLHGIDHQKHASPILHIRCADVINRTHHIAPTKPCVHITPAMTAAAGAQHDLSGAQCD